MDKFQIVFPFNRGILTFNNEDDMVTKIKSLLEFGNTIDVFEYVNDRYVLIGNEQKYMYLLPEYLRF